MSMKGLYGFYHKLDRSLFIDNEYKAYAKYDSALPIGYSQTISQPSLVYEMTRELDVGKDCKVLEIGTGSGYQTVLLAEFSREVYTVEFISELSYKAQERLSRLGYENIRFRIGDGSLGWPEFTPYDRIMVTAASRCIPERLISQLAAGGRMIIPVGARDIQELTLVTKDQTGKVSLEKLSDVVFVELKGEYGWSDDKAGGMGKDGQNKNEGT